MAFNASAIKIIVLVGSIFVNVRNTDPKPDTPDLSKFCELFASQEISNAVDIDKFNSALHTNLDEIGNEIFGKSDHLERMEEAKHCTFRSNSTPQCIYSRIATIGTYLTEDMKSLEKQLDPDLTNTENVYDVLISTWYMDPVFHNLRCSFVDPSEPQPTVQWEYIAKWSKLLLSRQDSCTWSKPLQRIVATNIRGEVEEICGYKSTEAICYLRPVFDLVDSVDNMCNFVSSSDWTSSELFKYYQSALQMNLFFFRQKMSDAIDGMYDSELTENVVRKGIIDIFYKLFTDFKANNLSFLRSLLNVCQNQCICHVTTLPLFRLFIGWSVQWQKSIRNIKFLTSNLDIRKYMQNLKMSKIRELAEKIQLILR